MRAWFSFFRRHSPDSWILLLGTGLRILWAIAVPVVPVSDSNAYDVFALNLATGQGYGWEAGSPTAYWPPGTSFIYAIFYKLFGHSYLPIVIFNLFLAVAIIWVSMRLAEIWFCRRTAVITGLLLACWPALIEYTTILASELIFTALTFVSILIWVNEKRTLRSRAIVNGLVLGVTSYVRPTAYLFPLVLGTSRIAKTREVFKTIVAVLITIAIIAALLLPWSYRNTQAFGQFSTVSTNSGVVLWMGNNPNSNGGYMSLPSEVKGMNEAERNRYLKDQAVAYIKERPLLFIQRSLVRILDTYNRQTIAIAWNEKGLVRRYGSWILLPLKILNQLFWVPVLSLGIIGVLLLWRQQGVIGIFSNPAVLSWGYLTAVHAVIISNDRYHFPTVPAIAIFAAFTLNLWLDYSWKVKPRQSRTNNKKLPQ